MPAVRGASHRSPRRGEASANALPSHHVSKRAQHSRQSAAPSLSSMPAAAAAAAAAANLVPPTAQQLQQAPLAAFTQWNETAMEALRAGDGDASRRILASLLPVLEARLHGLECKRETQNSSSVLDSWRLAYALTLNNDGCQLRRDGHTEAALRQFLRAKQVEALVFGKPSCSTMLNLSAVLLSSGATEEALAISKDCVTAAQDGEPILFITALHNLAVALGQQRSERERKAALPTMLQALREAQSALGEQHPTTAMLKEKCGLTTSWITPDTTAAPSTTSPRDGEWAALHGTASDDPAARPNSAGSQTAAQERARAALHTLNFGEPVLSQKVTEALAAAVAEGQRRALQGGVNAADISQHTTAATGTAAAAARLQPHPSSPSPPPPPASNRHDVAAASRAGAVETDGMTTTSTPLADAAFARPIPVSRRRSSVAASVDQCRLDSTNLSGTQRSVGGTPLETVLQEPFHAASLVMSRSVPNHIGPAGSIRSLCKMEPNNNGGSGAPAFLRFSVAPPRTTVNAASLPLRKIAPATVPPPTATGAADAERRRGAPTRSPTWRRLSDSGDDEEENGDSTATTATSPAPPAAGDVASGDRGKVGTAATLPTPPQRSLFAKSGGLHSGRMARRDADLQEDRAYRARREAERQAAEAETAFHRGLKAVQLRTQHRVAATIQRAWHHWWTSVGRPRRHVQLQRLEELQRRRRERLALSTAGAKKTGKLRTVTVPPAPSQQHGYVGGVVVPAVVLRCARKWLAATVCVRYLARAHHCAVDARLRETDVYKRLCTIQALWRGALVRHRRSQEKQQQQQQQLQQQRQWPDRDGAAVNAAAAARQRREEAELREYSAMVLQRAYRCHRARQTRRQLYLERHNPPAAAIQHWLRVTWADQRHRGVDARTMRTHHAAAVAIQRVWRGHLGRVAFRMRELRRRMDNVGRHPLAIEAGAGAGQQQRAALEDRKPGRSANGAATEAPSPAPPPEADTAVVETREARAAREAAALKEAYEADCLQRSAAVQQLRDAERDRYHIGLYIDTLANKERLAWQESLRLRPSEVLRRRVEIDSRVHEEQRVFTERRAALVIQRAYRNWHKMQQDPNRDTNLLYYSRALYQQHELGSLVERKQRRRENARAVALYGDSARSAREAHATAARDLSLVADCDGPASSSSGVNGIIAVPRADARAVAPFAERVARKEQRREEEAAQRRDEVLLALTLPHDMEHARESPEACAARIGTTYEHPYYTPYVNEEHRRTLGID